MLEARRGRLIGMLDRFPAHATVAVSDMERAKSWYADKLGLKPAEEDVAGAWYEYASSAFLLFETPFAGSAQNTVMSWLVDDASSVVSALKANGVSFDTFEMEGLEWDGEIAKLGNERTAWFKDSEGNTLAITQR